MKTAAFDWYSALLITCSVFLMVLGSYFAKLLLPFYSAEQVLWFRFVGYLGIMLIPTFLLHSQELMRPKKPKWQLLLGVVGLVVAFVFLLALERMPLAEAMSILFVYPFLIYIFAIIFLGEKSSLFSWIAICIGFLGAILIIQPSEFGFNWGIVFALLSALFLAIRFSLIRAFRISASPLVTAFWERLIGFTILSLIVSFAWKDIERAHMLTVAYLIACGIVAQLTFVYAISRAELRVLAPFVYLEVVFALAIDFFLLDLILEPQKLLGAIIILVSALSISMRDISRR